MVMFLWYNEYKSRLGVHRVHSSVELHGATWSRWCTIGAREERKVRGVSGHGGFAAHIVVVVALRRRRRDEGRRRRQARGPSPRTACEGVHRGERPDVAHARDALAAGRLRAPADRYPSPAAPPATTSSARALRSPPALRTLPTTHTSFRFVLNF